MCRELALIYETVLEACTPITCDHPWSFLQANAGCWTLNVPIDELQQRLMEQHDVTSLIRSRIMISGDDGELVVNPMLRDADPRLIVLRDRDSVAIDMLAETGTCSGTVPLFRLLEDAPTRRRIDLSDSAIFVVPTFDDLMLFRSLNLGAAPLTSLDALSFEDYRRLAKLAGASYAHRRWRQIPDELAPRYDSACGEVAGGHSPPQVYPLTLIFVAVSVCGLNQEINRDFCRVAASLTEAQQFLDMQLDDVHVWWPTEEQVAALRFLCELRRPQLIRAAILDNDEHYALSNFRDPSSPPPRRPTRPGLAATLDALIDLEAGKANGGGAAERVKEVRKTYEETVNRDLLRPMLEAALRERDPVRANLQACAAHLFRNIHLAAPGLNATLRERIRTGHISNGQELVNPVQLSQMRDLVRLVVSLCNQLRQDDDDGW